MRSTFAALLVLCSACVEGDPPALRTLVTVIATQEGQPVEDATRSIVTYGPRALVVIEAALHTAPPAGRRRLVRAIRKLGDRDAAALLTHLAEYDEDAGVRDEAKATLAVLPRT